MFFVLICLSIVYITRGHKSILYDSQWKGFRNWTIKEVAMDGTTQFIAHNSTKRLDIRPTNITFFNEVRIYSDVITVHPAWEIFVIPSVSAKQKPFSNTEHCIKEFSLNCGTLKIADYITKPEVGNLHSINYQSLSGSNSFSSGQKYTTSLYSPRGSYDLFRYVRFQFKFHFHYPSAKPPRTLYEYVNITRLVVTYNNCPEIVHDLAMYPNVAAAREKSRRVESSGECVENAERADVKGKLLRFCDANANAEFIGRCACSKGFQERDNKCKACPPNHYRDSIKDPKCTKCGARTDVIKERTECQCRKGFQRLASERNMNRKDCYLYPNPPEEIKLINSKNHIVIMSWKHPTSQDALGDFPLRYTIACIDKHLQSKICREKSSTNITSTTSRTIFTIPDTLPFTTYRFKICVHTEVSQSNNYEQDNCKEREILTPVGLPTKVRKFDFRISNDGIQLVWDKPIATGSRFVTYYVQCGNARNGTWTDIPSFFYRIGSMAGSIKCTVKAKSSVGFGPSVTRLILAQANVDKNNGDNGGGNSNYLALIGGAIAAVVVLLIIGLLTFRFYKSKQRNQDALVSAIETIMSMKENNLYGDNVRRELEHRMRNIYVPLDVLLNQSVVELSGEEPIYEEVPPAGYNYPYRKLKKIHELGEGNFATVSQCEATDICGRDGKSVVAVKQLKDDSSENDEIDFEGELGLMQEFKYHPNVVKLLGICTYPRCMIVEYLPGGDLLSFMVRSRRYRDETEEMKSNTAATAEGSFLTATDLLDFAHQISKGMQHIASCRVVHRDLACRNILVGYNRICKIADFGLAKKIDDSGIYKREKQAKLPVKWLPPESIRYGRSTLKSDIWSFGIVLWEIVTIGAVPYPGKKSKEVPELLKQGYRMDKPEHCSDELYELMLNCWSEDELTRPSFTDVVQNIEDLENGMSSYINMNVYSDDSYLTFESDELDEEEIVVNLHS